MFFDDSLKKYLHFIYHRFLKCLLLCGAEKFNFLPRFIRLSILIGFVAMVGLVLTGCQPRNWFAADLIEICSEKLTDSDNPEENLLNYHLVFHSSHSDWGKYEQNPRLLVQRKYAGGVQKIDIFLLRPHRFEKQTSGQSAPSDQTGSFEQSAQSNEKTSQSVADDLETSEIIKGKKTKKEKGISSQIEFVIPVPLDQSPEFEVFLNGKISLGKTKVF